MIKISLTHNQQKVMDFINEYMDKYNESPSFQNIMDGCKFTSKNSVTYFLERIEERGHIIKLPNKDRSITRL